MTQVATNLIMKKVNPEDYRKDPKAFEPSEEDLKAALEESIKEAEIRRQLRKAAAEKEAAKAQEQAQAMEEAKAKETQPKEEEDDGEFEEEDKDAIW